MSTSPTSGGEPSSANLATLEEPSTPGVYGLQLRGLDEATLLSRVNLRAPALNVSIELGEIAKRVELFEDDRAEISLIEYGWISLTREGHARFLIPAPVPVDEIVHPWLVPAAATFNGWHGRQVLHGGVFSHDGRAVAVLGEKEDGKSSLLAWLSRDEEIEILADDLVVVENRTVFAGPGASICAPDPSRPWRSLSSTGLYVETAGSD